MKTEILSHDRNNINFGRYINLLKILVKLLLEYTDASNLPVSDKVDQIENSSTPKCIQVAELKKESYIQSGRCQ